MNPTAVTFPPEQPLLPNINRESAGILDRAVCITLQIGGIGNRKKVSTDMIEVPLEDGLREPGEFAAPAPAVDKTWLGVSKALLDSPQLRAIRKLDGKIRQYVYEKCLPFRVGIHLLPMELVTKVEEQLKRFASEREQLIEMFLAAYPSQIEAAGDRLLVLFNPNDYKGVSSVRQAFTFDWQYVSFGTPGKLRDISPALFQAEQEKAAKKWEEASEAIQQVLRTQMRDLVDRLRSRLAPDPDGKTKKFRKENVDNLREFLEDFDVRNVTSDSELKALVQRARALLGNVAADDLRSDERLRKDLAEGFATIKGELDDIVVEGAARSISFEEE